MEIFEHEHTLASKRDLKGFRLSARKRGKDDVCYVKEFDSDRTLEKRRRFSESGIKGD